MSMLETYIIVVLFPLIVTNILHMLLVKLDYFSAWTIPLSIRYFGKNKTWRGFLFVPIVNAAILMLIKYMIEIEIQQTFLLGFFFGLAYVLFELPNSFLKRKLGIQSGGQHPRFKITFSVLDKMDSALGVALVYFLLGFAHLEYVIILFLFNSLIHALLSYLLVLLNMKKSF